MQITGWENWTERRERHGERITARARYENEIGVLAYVLRGEAA